MTILAFNLFGGKIPKLGVQKQPETAAQIARNCDLLSGDIDALRPPYLVHRFPRGEGDPIIRRAFRLLANDTFVSDFWMGFETKFTHLVRGSVIGDSFERYYWTEEGQRPRYNTRARIEDGDPPYLLGVPAPVTAPTVTPSGGTPDLETTRVYLYTFVSEFGEEGAPSPPTVAIGNDDGTWEITTMDTTVPDAAERPAFTKRIYRTVSGLSGTSYFFVAEIPLLDATYTDTLPTDDVVLNDIIGTIGYNEPPPNLVGLRVHPNGFMVGFVGDELSFSDPYRPHAWPAEYILATQYDIVETGIFGQSIGIATKAFPYIATGVNPASIALIKKETPAPCESRYGITATANGIVYVGPDGLMLLGPRGISNLTEQLLTRTQWETGYFPKEQNLALYRNFVIGLFGERSNRGYLITGDSAPGPLIDLEDFTPTFDSCQTDLFDGQFQLVRENEVYKWDDPRNVPLNFKWQSREIVVPKPCNFGVYRVDFEPQVLGSDDAEVDSEWNNNRIAYPLDMLDYIPFDDVAVIDGISPTIVPQNRQAMGGSPLFVLGQQIELYVTVSLWMDGVRVYFETVTQPGRYRLPSGFKSDIWAVEMNGNARVKHLKLAGTGKELGQV